MIIDAHIHLWRLGRGDNLALTPEMGSIYRDLEPQDVKPKLDAAGVSLAVLVQAAETLAEALFIVGLARKFPWIAGIIAWIDCDIHAIHEAGDHYIVIGRVRNLDRLQDKAPLIFHQGGYGSITELPRG